VATARTSVKTATHRPLLSSRCSFQLSTRTTTGVELCTVVGAAGGSETTLTSTGLGGGVHVRRWRRRDGRCRLNAGAADQRDNRRTPGNHATHGPSRVGGYSSLLGKPGGGAQGVIMADILLFPPEWANVEHTVSLGRERGRARGAWRLPSCALCWRRVARPGLPRTGARWPSSWGAPTPCRSWIAAPGPRAENPAPWFGRQEAMSCRAFQQLQEVPICTTRENAS